MVEHWGSVLAVECTYIPTGASIGGTDGIAVKRRTGVGEDGLCWCYPLGMAESVPWSRRKRVGYDRRARGEAWGGGTCSRRHLYP